MYLYETMKCNNTGPSMKISFSVLRSIIKAHEKLGHRYLGWIPKLKDMYGHTSEIDLVFESYE